MSLLIVLSGPGGVGKTSLAMELVRRHDSVDYTKSVTTRKPRAGPLKEEQYDYVSEPEFENLRNNDAFVQWINPPGLEFFGTRRAPIDAAIAASRDLVFDYVPEGLLNMRRAYPEQTIGIFVMAPSIEMMRNRLLARGTDGADEADIRTEMAYRDFDVIDLHDYIVVNEDFETALAEIEAIRRAEHLRTSRAKTVDRFRRHARKALLRFY